jgi:WXG100 family type VII secretion target
MGTKFSITGDAVNVHASNLDTSVNELNSRARAFLSAIEPLPAVWKGTAFSSWEQLTTAWNDAMADLNTALAGIRGRVSNSGSLYDRYHAEQASELSRTTASADWDAARFRQ